MPGKAAEQRKEEARVAQLMDAIMASEAGRSLVAERAQDLGLTGPSTAPATATPSPELAQLQTIAMASLADTVTQSNSCLLRRVIDDFWTVCCNWQRKAIQPNVIIMLINVKP